MSRNLKPEWIKDLDKRCEEHMKLNPEPVTPPQKLLPASVIVKNNVVFTVEESPYLMGSWRVLKGGEILSTFYGPLAHQDALRYVNDILGG